MNNISEIQKEQMYLNGQIIFKYLEEEVKRHFSKDKSWAEKYFDWRLMELINRDYRRLNVSCQELIEKFITYMETVDVTKFEHELIENYIEGIFLELNSKEE